MNSEHDSVAVIAEDLRTMADRVADYGISGMSGRASLIAVASRLERLTREDGPQASGGDDWLPMDSAPKDGSRVLLCFKDAQALPQRGDGFGAIPFVGSWAGKYMQWGFAAPVGMGGFPDDWLIGWRPLDRLATPDSAIQSQQGATGGAVDDAAVDRFWDAYIDKGKGGGVIGYSDVRRLLTATLAHPQAAGSAPGEAQREAWQSAVNDAGEIFTNADTANRDAIRSRASRVVTWLKANPPSAGSVASGAGDAVGYVAQDGSVIWYTDNFGTHSAKPKPGTQLFAAGSAPVGVED